MKFLDGLCGEEKVVVIISMVATCFLAFIFLGIFILDILKITNGCAS